MKLNKKLLLQKVSETSSMSVSQVQVVLAAFQAVIVEELVAQQEVQFLDLGKLKVSHRQARTGVNPKTKEAIALPAKDVPRLAASNKLKCFVAKDGIVTVKSFTY